MTDSRMIPLPVADLGLIGAIEDLLPRHARSVVLLHGEGGEPSVYRVDPSEAKHVRRAIREARAQRDLAAIEARACPCHGA